MTSLETLLAAANFVEASDRPDSCYLPVSLAHGMFKYSQKLLIRFTCVAYWHSHVAFLFCRVRMMLFFLICISYMPRNDFRDLDAGFVSLRSPANLICIL